MHLRVLIDNNTLIDEYYLGEPAASYYVEQDGNRILFDAGYSGALLQNANAMGISLSDLTHIVISHGHNDHTNGLEYLFKTADFSNVQLIAHPDCFYARRKGKKQLGPPFTDEEVKSLVSYIPARAPFWLSANCVFLGQIPRYNDFENKDPLGEVRLGEKWSPDYLYDDSAMVCRTTEGLFVITGCSHSGICNIVDYAVKVCGDSRITGIIGGFHLRDGGANTLATAEHLRSAGVETVYPCHCVSLNAKVKLIETLDDVQEVGVGMCIDVT